MSVGRVTATAGRRVVVTDEAGERVCFLAGRRAVIGDRVEWVDAQGEGGKVAQVLPRRTALVRTDLRAREQVVAANLEGIAVVAAPREPPFRPGLVDRYLVAAASSKLAAFVVLNKSDRGVPADVQRALAAWRDVDVEVFEVSAYDGTGLDGLAARVAAGSGPWALVGHSGVGKTSLVAALVPDEDAGRIGPLSEHWGTGQHTTTGSKLFALPAGGELVDSPGIRTFAPGRITAVELCRYFAGMQVTCRYRDCLHRVDEDGCVADAQVPAERLASYRRLLADLLQLDARRRPGRRLTRTKR